LAEADRLVTFYTRQYGKLRAVAKGARRPSCRFAGVVEPATQARFFFYRKPNRELALMTQHELIQSHQILRRDLDRYLQTCYVLEVVDHFAPLEEPNHVLWHLLNHALGKLAEDPAKAPFWLACFELRLLSVMGYHVRLGSCVSCDRAFVREGGVFDWASVGLRCRECAVEEDPTSWRLSAETIALAQRLQWASFEELENLGFAHEQVASIRSVLLPLLHRFSETPGEFQSLIVARAIG